MSIPPEVNQVKRPTFADVRAAIEKCVALSRRHVLVPCQNANFDPTPTECPKAMADCDDTCTICLACTNEYVARKKKEFCLQFDWKGTDDLRLHMVPWAAINAGREEKNFHTKCYKRTGGSNYTEICQNCAKAHFEEHFECCICKEHWVDAKSGRLTPPATICHAKGATLHVCGKCKDHRKYLDNDGDRMDERPRFVDKCCKCHAENNLIAFTVKDEGPAICVDCVLDETPEEIERSIVAFEQTTRDEKTKAVALVREELEKKISATKMELEAAMEKLRLHINPEKIGESIDANRESISEDAGKLKVSAGEMSQWMDEWKENVVWIPWSLDESTKRKRVECSDGPSKKKRRKAESSSDEDD